MNGHDLKEGMRVRVVLTGPGAFVLGKDAVSGRSGSVVRVGPSPLGGQPSWALVDLDGDPENPHRFNTWDLHYIDDEPRPTHPRTR